MPVNHLVSKPSWFNAISQVDWNVVATDMEISNAAAARMRWFRFKQQMEGGPRSKQNADTNRVAKPKSRAKAKPKMKKKTIVKGEGSDNDEGIMKEEGSDNDEGNMKEEEEEEGE